MMYAVVANRHTERVGGWQGSVQLPTFFLDSRVQGITSTAHAERIAREILGDDADLTVITAPAGEGE